MKRWVSSVPRPQRHSGGSGGEAGEERKEHTSVHPHEVTPFLNLALLSLNKLCKVWEGVDWFGISSMSCMGSEYIYIYIPYLPKLRKGVLGQRERENETHKPCNWWIWKESHTLAPCLEQEGSK